MDTNLWSIKLSTLDKRLKAFNEGYRQNLAFIGNDPEETSYLLQSYFQSNNENKFIYIHLSASYLGKKEFLKAVAFSLLSGYAHRTDSLDNLIYLLNPTLPLTTENIKRCLKNNQINFLEILEIINTFINESNRQCIFIIEEFLEVANLFESFYSDFSKFIILEKNCMIILTASAEKEALKVFSDELNLLFGNFEIVSLKENLFLDSVFHLKNSLLPLKPSPFFLSFFVNLLGSNCLYYEIGIKAIKDRYRSEDEEGSIVSILSDCLYNPQTYCFQRFIKKIDQLKFNFKDFNSILEILFYLNQGYIRKKDLLALALCDSKELYGKLQKLTDLNYLVNFGDIYRISDTLFSFWLSHVFIFYSSSSLLNPKKRIQLYCQNLKKEIALFKEEFCTGSLEKVLQLFTCFKNDNLRLGKTRYSLPSIERAKTISDSQKDLHLIIGEGRQIIFAAIKSSDASDNDLFEFIEKGANIRGKGVKKIFISLGELPMTTRLIAKNNKITVWDASELNRLFQIYNKPVFIQ